MLSRAEFVGGGERILTDGTAIPATHDAVLTTLGYTCSRIKLGIL